MDDLIDEILLRLPPEDPGCLFRASLVCKRWRGLLTGSAFASRYRQFHRAPPLLGFFENQFLGCWFAAPSSPTSPVPQIHPGHRSLDALDSRHGLVLLDVNDPRDGLAVWDPLRRRQWDFPFPELPGSVGFHSHSYSAAVLCAADGCDHLDCRHTHGGGPFLVACVCDDEKGTFYASMYSSEASTWSPVTSAEHPAATNLNTKPKVLVGNALYFTCHCEPTVMIVRYDVASHELSIFDGLAASQANHNQYVLVETDDRVLGFANVQGSKLCLWSTEASADGRAVTWARQRAVELEKLFPPLAFSTELYVTGFTEGVGVIVLTYAGTFTIELKSGRVKNVPGAERILHAFPYSSFYTPDFDLALKMLHIARTILEKCPSSSMDKVKVFAALADVKIMSTLGRGSLGRVFFLRYFPYITPRNVSICLIFELESNIGDAVAYCAKAISVCKSRVSNLKNGKEALLLDNGDNASAAEAGSERSALSYELEFLTGMSCKLEKKLEHLEQAIPIPATEANGEQNVGDATPRAASSTPVSDLLELLSTFDPVLRKTSCTPIWPELQNV
ncbi:hypothetical protein ACQ4PT_065872 [Festuca glaucescens]